ncbi:MAG TPA: hypothetical protein DCS73_01110 [Roseburia sp.]|nr:hypothetical protein [Roseburia sp.]
MYGIISGIVDENHVLVKPFWEEEMVAVYGTEEQMEEIQFTLDCSKRERDTTSLIVFFDEELLELKQGEEGTGYGE